MHASARFRLLGDGVSPLSGSADGVYLLSLQLAISSGDKTPSAPFYFVLNKNPAASELGAAVASLGFAPGRVQFAIPEPGSASLIASSVVVIAFRRRTWRARR